VNFHYVYSVVLNTVIQSFCCRWTVMLKRCFLLSGQLQMLLLFVVKVTEEDGAAGIQAICTVAAWRLRLTVLWEAVNSLAVWRWKISLCPRGVYMPSYISTCNIKHFILHVFVLIRLAVWYSGRTSVFGRRTFPVLSSTCSWRVTTYVGKPSAIREPTRPTQPFIRLGSIDE